MSRAQMLARGRRIGLHVLLCMLPGLPVGGVRRHELTLASLDSAKDPGLRVALVAHVRRVVRRRGAGRAKASLPPARDTRQGGLF